MMGISLKQQLDFCARNVRFQKECINSFEDKDLDDELFEMNALIEDLGIMEAIRDTIRFEYLLEQEAKRLTESEGVKYEMADRKTQETQEKKQNSDKLQESVRQKLVDQYGIDGSKVLFLNATNLDEPWIPPTELKSIARRSGGFKRIAVKHDKYVPETEQVVCEAQVVDNDCVEYISFGVATMGESNGLGAEISAEVLASGRAISAALTDAGFNPLKSNSVVDSDQPNQIEDMNVSDFASQAVKRNRDLKRIHALVYECGLIVKTENGEDKSAYQRWLFFRFPHFFNSALDASTAALTEVERQQVINKLANYAEIEGVKQAA